MYRSYYPHRSRDSLSPICGIFCAWLKLCGIFSSVVTLNKCVTISCSILQIIFIGQSIHSKQIPNPEGLVWALKILQIHKAIRTILCLSKDANRSQIGLENTSVSLIPLVCVTLCPVPHCCIDREIKCRQFKVRSFVLSHYEHFSIRDSSWHVRYHFVNIYLELYANSQNNTFYWVAIETGQYKNLQSCGVLTCLIPNA